jgi:hypothetical protein
MQNTMIQNEISFLRKKLRKLKKILSTNVEIWDETQHDPVEEFKLLIKLIDEAKPQATSVKRHKKTTIIK